MDSVDSQFEGETGEVDWMEEDGPRARPLRTHHFPIRQVGSRCSCGRAADTRLGALETLQREEGKIDDMMIRSSVRTTRAETAQNEMAGTSESTVVGWSCGSAREVEYVEKSRP